jgi:hypothetical protein
VDRSLNSRTPLISQVERKGGLLSDVAEGMLCGVYQLCLLGQFEMLSDVAEGMLCGVYQLCLLGQFEMHSFSSSFVVFYL